MIWTSPLTRTASMRPSVRRLAGCVLVLCVLLAGCKEDVYTKLSEREANEILGALLVADIDAGKQTADGKEWRVAVDKADMAAALAVLRQAGLPRERFASMGEVFKREGLVSTPSEERIRYVYAVSQELSNTLSRIDGVVAARVHVVIPANDPLSDTIKPSSASVFISHRADADVAALAPVVKDLVQRSIEGLKYENVSLTLLPVRPLAALTEPGAAGGTTRTAWIVFASSAVLGAGIIFALLHLGIRRTLMSWLLGLRALLSRRALAAAAPERG